MQQQPLRLQFQNPSGDFISTHEIAPDLQELLEPALFVEWDDKPIEWQLTAWQKLGLPRPSLQVSTGGKSLHTYWVSVMPAR